MPSVTQQRHVSNRRAPLAQGVLVFLGAAMVILALSADWIGLGGEPGFGSSQILLAAVGFGVALTAFVIPLQHMSKYLYREIFTTLILVIVGLLIGVILSELILSNIFAPEYKFYVWPPNLRKVFRPVPEVMPGVNGESRFYINSSGIRGDELSGNQSYRILAIGGSTTECLFIDQAESWPYLLQKLLNTNDSNDTVWVGNIGKSGLNTRHHVLELRYLLPQYQNIDAIVMLIGLNDLLMRLAQDAAYDPNYLIHLTFTEKLLRESFSILPRSQDITIPYYKRTEVWHLARNFKALVLTPHRNTTSTLQIQDDAGTIYTTWREHRHNAIFIRNNLPDFSSSLEEYTMNVNAMIDMARRKSVRIIFMTQPVLWREGLAKELEDLMWMGGVGAYLREDGKEYYSVKALANGMKMYNDTLLRICERRRVECVDLASYLPHDTTVFYDDAHFNETGSAKVAHILFQYMRRHKPFL